MADAMAITGAAALLGEQLRRVDAAVVVVEDGRITAAGPAPAVEVPANASVFDGRGRLLVPGFIDAHVHIAFAHPLAVLAGGVTTARDLGWPAERIFPLARRSRAHDFDGPTILAAGCMLTAPGGYPQHAAWAPRGTALPVPDELTAEHAVKVMTGAGASVIKVALDASVGPTLSPAALAAVVHAAHRAELKVTAHISGLDELDKALDAGLDELAHMLLSPERIPDDTLKRMVAQGMTLVPTLSVFEGRALDVALDNLERFVAAGGRVVYGTDLGNDGPRPGIEAREVRAMMRAGMSAVDVVRSATVTAARWLELDSVGAIAVGRDADLVALHGSELDSPEALSSVAGVWRRGRTVPARGSSRRRLGAR